MNDIIVLYVNGLSRGLEYNPMYKFNGAKEFFYKLETHTGVPKDEEIIVEGYRGDNLICVNETFKSFSEKLRWVTGF